MLGKKKEKGNDLSCGSEHECFRLVSVLLSHFHHPTKTMLGRQQPVSQPASQPASRACRKASKRGSLGWDNQFLITPEEIMTRLHDSRSPLTRPNAFPLLFLSWDFQKKKTNDADSCQTRSKLGASKRIDNDSSYWIDVVVSEV